MYTRPVPNGRLFSGSWLVPENLCFSCTNQKPEWRRPFGTGLVRYCPRGLFSPFFTFLRAKCFRPFRLSLVPTICPWVSEDDSIRAPLISVCFVIREDNSQKCRRCFCFTTEPTSSRDYPYCGFLWLTTIHWNVAFWVRVKLHHHIILKHIHTSFIYLARSIRIKQTDI